MNVTTRAKTSHWEIYRNPTWRYNGTAKRDIYETWVVRVTSFERYRENGNSRRCAEPGGTSRCDVVPRAALHLYLPRRLISIDMREKRRFKTHSLPRTRPAVYTAFPFPAMVSRINFAASRDATCDTFSVAHYTLAVASCRVDADPTFCDTTAAFDTLSYYTAYGTTRVVIFLLSPLSLSFFAEGCRWNEIHSLFAPLFTAVGAEEALCLHDARQNLPKNGAYFNW